MSSRAFQILFLLLPLTSYLPCASVFPSIKRAEVLIPFIPKLLVRHYCKDRAAICPLAGISCLLMRLADSSQKNIKPKQGWLETFLMTFIPLILSTVSELAKSDLFNRLFWQLNNSQLCNSTFSAIKTREIFFLCSLRIVY